MNQQRTLIVLVIALITAAVASYTVYRAIEGMPVREVEIASVPVAIASRELAVGTQLTSDHIRVVAWPQKSQPLGAYARVDDLIGRGVIETIGENEPITVRRIAGAEAGAGLPPVIPAGLRAISVRVDEVIGVAGYVTPGTHVDVLVAIDDPGATVGRRDVVARTILSNVRVLAAGTRSDQQTGRDVSRFTVVTLAVSPEDGARIALASNEGRISLMLRNPLDVGPTETRGARLSTLLREPTPDPPPTPEPRPVRRVAPPVVAAAPPSPPPPAVHRVETIRAARRSEEVID